MSLPPSFTAISQVLKKWPGLLRQPPNRRCLCPGLLPIIPNCRPPSHQDPDREVPPHRLGQRRHLPRRVNLPHRCPHPWRGRLFLPVGHCYCVVDNDGRPPSSLHSYAQVAPIGFQGESPVPSALLQAADPDQHAASSFPVVGNHPRRLASPLRFGHGTDRA